MKNYFLVIGLLILQTLFCKVASSQIVVEQEETDTREVYDSWETALASPAKVQVLNLAYKKITSLSADISKFKNLEEIYLDENLLKSLPKELFSLPNLKKIDISGNISLTDIPACVAKLPKLEFFKFGNNNQRNCASTFKNLAKIASLKTVDMMSGKIVYLPSEIGALAQIEELNLSDNRLHELPEEIGQLKNLKKLDLSQNQLTKLPQSITKLTNLKELFIIGNQFSDAEIASIKKKLPACKIDL